MSPNKRNVLVGVVVLAAIGVLAWMVLKFANRASEFFLTKGDHIRVVADRADGLSEGSAIYYRGVSVGRVLGVRLDESNRVSIEAIIEPGRPVPETVEGFIRTGAFDPEDFDETFEFDNSNAMVDAGTYAGHAGLLEYLALMRQMWEQFRFEPEEYIPVGQDKVVVPWLITAVGRDGVETTAYAATVFTVRSGRLAHAKAFQSKADALEAVGPSD